MHFLAAVTPDVSTGWLIGTLVAAIALILFLILKWRVQAFVALLLASVFVGVVSGTMELTEVGDTIKDSMGSSLGFIATIIGLGAIFGSMIEHSGGAQSLANGLLKFFGEKKANWLPDLHPRVSRCGPGDHCSHPLRTLASHRQITADLWTPAVGRYGGDAFLCAADARADLGGLRIGYPHWHGDSLQRAGRLADGDHLGYFSGW